MYMIYELFEWTNEFWVFEKMLGSGEWKCLIALYSLEPDIWEI